MYRVRAETVGTRIRGRTFLCRGEGGVTLHAEDFSRLHSGGKVAHTDDEGDE